MKKCILNPCCGLAGGELVICRSRTKWSLGWWGVGGGGELGIAEALLVFLSSEK